MPANTPRPPPSADQLWLQREAEGPISSHLRGPIGIYGRRDWEDWNAKQHMLMRHANQPASVPMSTLEPYRSSLSTPASSRSRPSLFALWTKRARVQASSRPEPSGSLFLQVAIIVYPGIFMEAMKVNLLVHINNSPRSPRSPRPCQRFGADLARVCESGFSRLMEASEASETGGSE